LLIFPTVTGFAHLWNGHLWFGFSSVSCLASFLLPAEHCWLHNVVPSSSWRNYSYLSYQVISLSSFYLAVFAFLNGSSEPWNVQCFLHVFPYVPSLSSPVPPSIITRDTLHPSTFIHPLTHRKPMNSWRIINTPPNPTSTIEFSGFIGDEGELGKADMVF